MVVVVVGAAAVNDHPSRSCHTLLFFCLFGGLYASHYYFGWGFFFLLLLCSKIVRSFSHQKAQSELRVSKIIIEQKSEAVSASSSVCPFICWFVCMFACLAATPSPMSALEKPVGAASKNLPPSLFLVGFVSCSFSHYSLSLSFSSPLSCPSFLSFCSGTLQQLINVQIRFVVIHSNSNTVPVMNVELWCEGVDLAHDLVRRELD